MAKGKADAGGSKGGGKGKPTADDKNAKAKVGGQQLSIRHILCEKHGKKEEALAKLKTGAKFDDVAREFSEDKAKTGGALGWKGKNDLQPAFEAVAWSLQVSTTAKPVYGEAKTSEGYHIIMVDGAK